MGFIYLPLSSVLKPRLVEMGPWPSRRPPETRPLAPTLGLTVVHSGTAEGPRINGDFDFPADPVARARN